MARCYKHGAEHSQKRGISVPPDRRSAGEVFFSEETLKPTRIVARGVPPSFRVRIWNYIVFFTSGEIFRTCPDRP